VRAPLLYDTERRSYRQTQSAGTRELINVVGEKIGLLPRRGRCPLLQSEAKGRTVLDRESPPPEITNAHRKSCLHHLKVHSQQPPGGLPLLRHVLIGLGTRRHAAHTHCKRRWNTTSTMATALV